MVTLIVTAAKPAPSSRIALVLQGGGALGSYQGGAYAALSKAGYQPNWIAGISIGAINGAIIAGNAPEQAVEKLHDFWMLISSSVTPLPFMEEWLEHFFSETAATHTLLHGAPGFFKPRFSSPFAPGVMATDALSYYDTSELKTTLEKLVDFDRINRKNAIRLSVGAVDVESGNFKYFDSHGRDKIMPEHVMASGALPPGLPPIKIGGTMFWDGGLVSNTPLQYVIDEDEPINSTIFQVDLFSAKGPAPVNLAEVLEREKDIRFSSRTRLNTDVLQQRQEIGAAALRLAEKLPAKWQSDPDLLFLRDQCCPAARTVVHLIYKGKYDQSFSKDYEFSRSSVEAHWAAGLHDVEQTLKHPDWAGRGAGEPGTIRVFDHGWKALPGTKAKSPKAKAKPGVRS